MVVDKGGGQHQHVKYLVALEPYVALARHEPEICNISKFKQFLRQINVESKVTSLEFWKRRGRLR